MSIKLLTKVNKIKEVNDMEKFSDRLRQLREEAGVSMNQLSRALEVSNAAICKWENGNAEPKVTYLIKLSEFFECSVDYLVGKTNDFDQAHQTESSFAIKMTNKEKNFINTFRELSPKMQNIFQQAITACIEDKK